MYDSVEEYYYSNFTSTTPFELLDPQLKTTLKILWEQNCAVNKWQQQHEQSKEKPNTFRILNNKSVPKP